MVIPTRDFYLSKEFTLRDNDVETLSVGDTNVV